MKKTQQTDLKINLPANFLASDFCNRFKLVVANTTKLQEEVYRIRYEVYCQELGYENEEQYPEGKEQDVYDIRSIHCLLHHRASGLYAGCVRLVFPAMRSHEAKLPFERVLGDSWRSGSRELRNLSLHSIGEVSRLTVLSKFRKRQVEAASNFSDDESCYFPLIPLGLYLAATSIAFEMKLDSVFALMEPQLSRHFARFGIHFHQVGELVEFYGQRGLYQIDKEAILSAMEPSTENLFQWCRTEVKKSLKNCPPAIRAA